MGDRLYIAHGTAWAGGPHHLAWVDLAVGEPVTGPLVPSEGFDVVREIDGTVYWPWADPTGPWDDPQGYTYSDGDGWATRLMFPAYHVIDMVQHDGDLFASGSGPHEDAKYAQVWRSRDGGSTWERSLALPGQATARVYSLIQADGSLWVWPTATTDPSPLRLEGDEWVPWETPNYSLHQYILEPAHNLHHSGTYYTRYGYFDGTQVGAYNRQAVSVCWADTNHAYALDPADGWIYRATHPTGGEQMTWVRWMETGVTTNQANTATLHDGYVYVGGTQGRIWRFPAP